MDTTIDLGKDMGFVPKKLHDTVHAFHSALKQHAPGSPGHTRILASHANHAPLIGELSKMGEAGSKVIHAMNRAANSKMNAGPKVPSKFIARSLAKGDDNKWAIATAAWQKVSPKKKARYVRAAMSRHKRAGEAVHAGKYAKRAPREFLERITSKSQKSFVEEFGQQLGGFLYKARRLLQKAQASSPVMAAVRREQMRNGSPLAKRKARQAGGGKTFNYQSLAKHAGVESDAIADLAHQSVHVHAFHEAVRKKFGLKHLTSAQIRSAYHSTGLENSMTAFGKALDFGSHKQEHASVTAPHGTYSIHSAAGTHVVQFKPTGGKNETIKQVRGAGSREASFKAAAAFANKHAAKFGKSIALIPSDLDLIKAHREGKRHVIGHTSTGKPVYSDGFGAERLRGEEHREAEELHRDLAGRLDSVASTYPLQGSSKLPAASRKYLSAIATSHRDLADRHGETVYQQLRPVAGGIQRPAPFGKSSPTDAEVAKAMESYGGAGSLTESMLLAPPLNVLLPQARRDMLHSGVQKSPVSVEQPSAPEVSQKKPAPIVGGVLSAAWDLGQPLR